MRITIKLFAFSLLLGIIVFPISAFAASNAGPNVAGEAAVPISGWAIANLDYQTADDPSLVTSVTFDLDAPADKVSVKLESQATEFAACTNVGGYHWQCNFQAGVKVSSMDEFRVIAVGN